MITINLLPWREQLRAEQKRRFLQGCMLSIVSAVSIIFIWHAVIDCKIDRAESFNRSLEQQNDRLSLQARQAQQMKDQQAKLVQQLDLLRSIQADRHFAADFLMGLSRATSNGLFLTKIIYEKNQIILTGKAESNTQVTDFLQYLNEIKNLKQAALQEITDNDARENKIGFVVKVVAWKA